MLSDLLAGFPPTNSTNRNQPTTQQQEQENVNNSSKMAKIEVESVEETDSFVPADVPAQKNKRRCFTCRQKLELAQRELGQCKCGMAKTTSISHATNTILFQFIGYVFCLLHRLPEQHNCVFDHKISGRQEAMKNMVDTGRKKIGRSFHRMDSKPEY